MRRNWHTSEEYSELNHGPVAVVGLGYVGLPLALLAAQRGYRVIGIDTNAEKARAIAEGKTSFEDARLQEQLLQTPLDASSDISRVAAASVVVVCVPTPVHKDHTPDLDPLRRATEDVGAHVKRGTLVVIESTINPGVCESVVIPLLEQASGLRVGEDIFLAHCPERINPGDSKWNVENISRVVGAYNEESLERAVLFYRSILSGDIKPMNSLKEAEAVKMVENSFRDINIAFVNELAMSFARMGIDVTNVIEGAASKPFGFFPHYPGCGVGGHCIPVDPYYLIAYGKENGFNHAFLALARKINNGMPAYTVGLLEAGLEERGKEVRGSKISVLGLSYKADIDDDRESPSYEIIEELEQRGAFVTAYDPYVLRRSTARSLDEALRGAAAVVVATAHAMFRALTPGYVMEKGIEVLVDGRNMFSKEEFTREGLVYKGIGR